MVDLTKRIEESKEAILAAMRDATPQEEFSSWEDLSDASVEAMVRRQLGTERFLDSHGLIHLRGAGVEGHSADLDAVGGVMMSFQRLVTAVGCFLKGDTSLRGRVPGAVAERTKMKLSAQPQPGSIVLLIEPKVHGMGEAFPQGPNLFDGYDDPNIPLADESAARLARTLSMVENGDLAPFIAGIEEMGPRVASSMREFLKETATDEFDTDVEWHEPGHVTLSASIPNERARLAYRAIADHNLDSAEEILTGTLVTLSTSKRLELRISTDDEEHVLSIKRGALSDATLAEFTVTQPVSMRVRTTQQSRPGGESSFIYEALSIERLVPDDSATSPAGQLAINSSNADGNN